MNTKTQKDKEAQRASYMAAYYAANREKIRAKSAAYYAANSGSFRSARRTLKALQQMSLLKTTLQHENRNRAA